MKKRTNKALEGRRNRVHGTLVFKYDDFDQATRMQLIKQLDEAALKDFRWAAVPKSVQVVNTKRSRVTDMQGQQLNDRVSMLESRVSMLAFQVKELIKDSHPPVELEPAIVEILKRVKTDFK